MRSVWNERGVGIVEVIIAAVILIIVGLGVSSYLSGSHKLSAYLGKKGACQSIAASVISDLETTDNKVDVYNALLTPKVTNGRHGRSLYEGGEYYTFQNIEGTFTKLFQMVRSNASFCSAVGADKGVLLSKNPLYLKDPKLLDEGFSIYMRITPNSGNCADIANISSENAGGNGTPIQLSVLITAEGPSTDGKTETCQAEASFGYGSDKNIPTITVDSIVGQKGGVTVTTLMPVNTICDTGVVDVQMTSNEPGSIFMCSTNNDPSTYVSCEGFQISPPVGGVISLLDPADNIPTSARLRFSGLPDGQYRFYAKSVDTAGNESVPTPVIMFTVDTLRPVWSGSLQSVADPVATPKKAVDNSSALPIGTEFTAAGTISNLFGVSQLYQCALDSTPRFQGQMNSSHGNEVCSWSTTSGIAANNGKAGSGTPVGVPPATRCEIAVSPATFGSGGIVLSAVARDVCNPAPAATPVGATTSTDWIIDPTVAKGGVAIGATHFTGSNIRKVAPLQAPVPPESWSVPHGSGNMDYTRSVADLAQKPIVWEIPKAVVGQSTLKKQNQSAGANPALRASYTDADTGWDSFLNTPASNSSCTYSRGFCNKAWGPCGQNNGSSNPPAVGGNVDYRARMGLAGASCWQVPCNTSSCTLGGTSKGTCGPALPSGTVNCDGDAGSAWLCTSHSECMGGSGNECVDSAGNPVLWNNQTLPSPVQGTCSRGGVLTARYCGDGTAGANTFHGDCQTKNGSIGVCSGGLCHCPSSKPIGYFPGLQNEKDNPCPEQFGAYCGGTDANCSCDSGIANTKCPAETFANSCNVPDTCRGTKIESCLRYGTTPILTVSCLLTPSVWLGARTDQTIFQKVGAGEWASGGFPFGGSPQYNYECSLDGLSFNAGTCNYGTWTQSPVKPTSPNLNYWVKAWDSRGDYEVCQGQYKLDRTPPVFPVAAAIKAGTCGTLATPTVSSDVVVSFTSDDSHSANLVSASNVTYPSVSNDCQNSNWNNTDCTTLLAPVTGDPNRDNAQKIRILATDEALNTTSTTIDAYAAVRSGLSHVFSEGTDSNNFSRRGCQSCANAPYNNPVSDTITGANDINFHSSMTIARRFTFTSGGPTSDSLAVASYPNPTRTKTDYFFPNRFTRGIEYRFVDSCGSRSAPFNSDIYLDWESPILSYDCDISSQNLSITSTDDVSGRLRLWGTCNNPSSGETVNFNISQGTKNIGLDVGTTTCSARGADAAYPRSPNGQGQNVGNNTDNADGTGGPQSLIGFSCTVPPDPPPCGGHAGHQTNCNPAWGSCATDSSCGCFYDGGNPPDNCVAHGSFDSNASCTAVCSGGTCAPNGQNYGGNTCESCSAATCEASGKYSSDAACESVHGTNSCSPSGIIGGIQCYDDCASSGTGSTSIVCIIPCGSEEYATIGDLTPEFCGFTPSPLNCCSGSPVFQARQRYSGNPWYTLTQSDFFRQKWKYLAAWFSDAMIPRAHAMCDVDPSETPRPSHFAVRWYCP